MFDCVTLAASIAAAVPRVEIGFTVVNSTFRNPAMTAKTAGTHRCRQWRPADPRARCRLQGARGAGVRTAVPRLGERLDILEEHFEIISRLTRRDEPAVSTAASTPGSSRRSTGRPRAAATHPAAHRRTWQAETFRIAARYCDELNIDLTPVEIPGLLEALHERCAEVGPRPGDDPAPVGLQPEHPLPGMRMTGGQRMMGPGDFPTSVIPTSGKIRFRRVPELLAGFRDPRIRTDRGRHAGPCQHVETLDEFIEDCEAAGMPLPSSVAA